MLDIDDNVCVLSTNPVYDLIVDECVGICIVEATFAKLFSSVPLKQELKLLPNQLNMHI